MIVVTERPRRVWFDKDMSGTVHIWMQYEGREPFDFIQIQYDYTYTSNAHQHVLATSIVQMLTPSDMTSGAQS